MDERIVTCKTYFNRAKKRICGLRNGFDKQFYTDGLTDVWASLDAIIGLRFSDRKKFCQTKKWLFEDRIRRQL